MNEINTQAGFEAINEATIGETQEEYAARMARIQKIFGPRKALTAEDRQQIAVREAIISAAIHVPKQTV